MLTRRALARNFGLLAAGLTLGGEAAYAQRKRAHGTDFVLLNANENPDGPPSVSIEAMIGGLARTGRYHDEDMEAVMNAIAAAEGLQSEQVLMGCGSSEILHCAVDAFTSAT